MKRITYSLLALGLLQSTTAMAQQPNFSYNTFGLQFGKTEISGFDDKFTNMGMNASLAINDSVFAFGEYEYLSNDNVDNTGVDVSGNNINLGIGLVFPVESNLDITTTISYVMTDAEACGGGVCLENDDKGFALSAGVNYWLTSNIDADARIAYVELDDANSSDTSYRLGIGYWPAKKHRVGLSYQSSDDADSILVNYRISQ